MFYYHDDEKFVWASEIKSILRSENIEKDICITALDYYFAYGYTPQDQSIYSEIKKLKPGHFFLFKPFEKVKYIQKSYWEINFEPDYSKTEAYWKEVIYETLNESVKIRMISDVPLGAFLSGGVDSSTVVALMSLNSQEPIKTFSIGFKEKKYSELQYARLIAEKYKTEHHEFIVEPKSLEMLPDLVRAFDEPFSDASAIPTYYVSKLTREFVTVALSGDGGDELFAGYNRYEKMENIYRNGINSKGLFSIINNLLPDYMYGKGYSYYLSKDRKNIGAYFCIYKDYERRKMFQPDITRKLTGHDSEKMKINFIDKLDSDFLSKMQKLDLETYLVDDILTKVDRTSMQNSLEARVPFLDHKFAELSFKIPSQLKINGSSKKYILKEAFKKILPEEVISHKKQGFAIPLNNWFDQEFKRQALDSIIENKNISNFIDKNYVNDLVKYSNHGMRDYSTKLWSLLFLGEWLNQNK